MTLRMNSRRNAVVLIVILLAVACQSDDGDGQAADAINPETMVVSGVRTVPLSGGDNAPAIVNVAPDGRTWSYATNGQMCVSSLGEIESGEQSDEPDDLQYLDDVCVDIDTTVSDAGAGWSSDSTRLVVTEDVFRTLVDSDILEFDTAEGRIEVLTDDGFDGPMIGLGSDDDAAEGADLDVAPFFGPDDNIYFWRNESRSNDLRFGLYRLGDDGPVPIEGGVLPAGQIPLAAAVPAGVDRWVLAIQDLDDPNFSVIRTLMLDNDTVDIGEVPTNTETAHILDASASQVIVVAQRGLVSATLGELEIVNLDDGQRATIPVGGRVDRLLGAAFAPDGTSVLTVVQHIENDAPSFSVFVADEDGFAAPVTIPIETSAELPKSGLGLLQVEIGWGPDAPFSMRSIDGNLVFVDISERTQ